MKSIDPMLVIQNDPTCPLGWFGEWFAEAGLDIAVRRAFADDVVPDGADGFGALVVLGGDMGANDDDTCPWLPTTKTLISAAIAAETPFLGICLGHQLAAAALGGTVARNHAGRAIGLTPVTLTDAGRADGLLGAVTPGSHAIQWNDDVVTAPPVGARVLATCPDGSPQALRFGPRAWGVQFHPEASPEIFSSWLADGDGDAARRIAAARADLRREWRGLADRFAAVCVAAA